MSENGEKGDHCFPACNQSPLKHDWSILLGLQMENSSGTKILSRCLQIRHSYANIFRYLLIEITTKDIIEFGKKWRALLHVCIFCDSSLILTSFLSPVSCSLPEKGDLLEELQYVELPQEQAQTLLQKYKDEARRLLPPITKQEKKKHRLHKKRPYPHGPPPAHRIRWLNGQHEK